MSRHDLEPRSNISNRIELDRPCSLPVNDLAVPTNLYDFKPVSLDEMDELSLLHRHDTKFLCPVDCLEEILAALDDGYHVLEIDGRRHHRYETLYFDTPNLALYAQHHDYIRPRHKVRCRRYVDSDLAFLEIKTREEDGRTLKERTRIERVLTEITPEARTFLLARGDRTVSGVHAWIPALKNRFYRVTLVSWAHRERSTIDLHTRLCWNGQLVKLDDWVIIEVKTNGPLRPSPLTRALRTMYLQPSSMSKYCVGVALLWPGVKRANFQTLLDQLAEPNGCGNGDGHVTASAHSRR